MTRPRRLAVPLVLVIASLVAANAAIVVSRTRAEAHANAGVGRVAVPDTVVEPAPQPSTPATIPSFQAPNAGAAAPTQPIDAPADPYQNEPIVQIGTIEIPRIKLVHPIFEGISLTVIDQLVPGDQVIFTIGNRRSVYVVTGHDVVTPSETQIVVQTPAATGTLFACHPPHSAKYRYVVHLKLLT